MRRIVLFLFFTLLSIPLWGVEPATRDTLLLLLKKEYKETETWVKALETLVERGKDIYPELVSFTISPAQKTSQELWKYGKTVYENLEKKLLLYSPKTPIPEPQKIPEWEEWEVIRDQIRGIYEQSIEIWKRWDTQMKKKPTPPSE